MREVFFVGIVLAMVLAVGETALACPICFRVEESATTDGAQAAVLVLVGVTTVVLGAFARFIAGFIRRESRLAARGASPALLAEDSRRSREPQC